MCVYVYMYIYVCVYMYVFVGILSVWFSEFQSRYQLHEDPTKVKEVVEVGLQLLELPPATGSTLMKKYILPFLTRCAPSKNARVLLQDLSAVFAEDCLRFLFDALDHFRLVVASSCFFHC